MINSCTKNAYLCTSDILALLCTSFSANPLVVSSMFIKELSLQTDLGRVHITFLSTDLLLRCEPKVLKVTYFHKITLKQPFIFFRFECLKSNHLNKT